MGEVMKERATTRVFLAVILCSLCLALLAAAADGVLASTSGSLKGKVTQIDDTAATITVEGKAAGMTFTIVAKTKFSGYRSAAEIRVGDTVMVSYTMRHGVAYAKRITGSKR